MNAQSPTLVGTHSSNLWRRARRTFHSLRSMAAGLLVAIVALLPAGAQAQAIEAWVQRYDGPANGDDYATAIAVDTSGNVYVTGQSFGGDPANGGSFYDWVTIKYSSTGVPLWTNRYNGAGNGNDNPGGLAVDASGNVFVTGSEPDPVSGWAFCTTIRYSSDGVPLWTNRYTQRGDGGAALAVDSNGNVFVTRGSYISGYFPDIDYDYATIKYSGTGVLLWTNRYSQPGILGDHPVALAVDASGNVVVTGRSQVTSGGANQYYATIKYSSAGVPVWTNRYTGLANGTDEAYAVAVDASGNVIVTGPSDGIGTSLDYATVKYSSAGVLQWTNFYNGPGNGGEDARAVAVDTSGNVYVTGISPGSGTGNDIATVAYSSSGPPLWTNRYNGPGNGNDYVMPPWAIAVDASGSVFVTGASTGSGTGSDFVTVKYVVPPIIARQPLSRTNAVGTAASFTVEAVGGVPLSYQWRRQGTNLLNGPNLSGVTTANLQIMNVQLADAAGYSIVVTNAYGSVTSAVAQLTVTIPPSPGRFTSFTYSPAMGFSFIFRDATVGQPYRIQRSPSLAEGSWSNWQSFTYSGPIGFMDVEATGAERRFYRAVSP